MGKESVITVKFTRREFLKVGGATAATFAVVDLGFDLSATAADVAVSRTRNVTPTPSVCPYCASGCGMLVFAERDEAGNFVKMLSCQGDPDNPINEGTACAKGAALFNMRNVYDPDTGELVPNPKRVQKPLYRAPYSNHWEEKEWDWIIENVADRIKTTRDESFEHKVTVEGEEVIVNRTERIGSMGGSGLDNEECYLISKLMRSLGIVYLETQARI